MKTNTKESFWNQKGRIIYLVIASFFMILALPTVAFGENSDTYTVAFDATGGTVKTSSTNVTFNNTYGKLPTPTRKNYTFLGWYTALYGGVKITKDSTVKRNYAHTLYARWRGKEANITLNPNGGTIGTTTIVARYGTKLNLPKATRTNYKFIGWFTQANGGDEITSKTIFDEKSKNTLYAHWEEKTLKIAFIAFNGDELLYKEVICGKVYGELPTPVKEGEKFVGWYTWKDYADLEAKPITATTIVTEKDPLKLFARWE